MCHDLAEHTHCQHDPNIFGVVRHPGVPKAKVSNDDATLLNRWLAWASHSPPLLEQMLFDTPACPLTVRTDLNVKPRQLSRMSSKPSRRKELLWSLSKTLKTYGCLPKLCTAVFRCNSDKRHIDDQRERVRRMCKVSVCVDRLSLWVCGGRHGRVSTAECPFRRRS